MVTIARSAMVKGYASTVVDAISARNVEGVKYASTVVNAVSARNVEGVKYASTVVNAVSARNVEGVKYAITVVDAICARNVEEHQYAITVVNAVGARNAKGVKNEANGTEAQTSHQGLVGYILKTHAKRKKRLSLSRHILCFKKMLLFYVLLSSLVYLLADRVRIVVLGSRTNSVEKNCRLPCSDIEVNVRPFSVGEFLHRPVGQSHVRIARNILSTAPFETIFTPAVMSVPPVVSSVCKHMETSV